MKTVKKRETERERELAAFDTFDISLGSLCDTQDKRKDNK